MKTLVILLLAITCYSQEKVSIAVYQDARLLTIGDSHGNPRGTINILARLKMQGNQQKYGYMVVFPEYEYANLKEPFNRYSANIGYTFNKLIINRLEASIYGGGGFVNRSKIGYLSLGGSTELSYKIKGIKINLLSQLTQRKDIDIWRVSGFVGLEINLN